MKKIQNKYLYEAYEEARIATFSEIGIAKSTLSLACMHVEDMIRDNKIRNVKSSDKLLKIKALLSKYENHKVNDLKVIRNDAQRAMDYMGSLRS